MTPPMNSISTLLLESSQVGDTYLLISVSEGIYGPMILLPVVLIVQVVCNLLCILVDLSGSQASLPLSH